MLINDGYLVEFSNDQSSDSMGLDFNSLSVYIPVVTASIAGVVSIVKAWLKNRSVEISFENKNNGRSCKYRSGTGKMPEYEDLKWILEAVNDKTSNED